MWSRGKEGETSLVGETLEELSASLSELHWGQFGVCFLLGTCAD